MDPLQSRALLQRNRIVCQIAFLQEVAPELPHEWQRVGLGEVAHVLQWVLEGLPSTCPRCPGTMLPGKALAQTFSGTPDFPGHEVVTISPGGPGELVDCLKCNICGHSVSV